MSIFEAPTLKEKEERQRIWYEKHPEDLYIKSTATDNVYILNDNGVLVAHMIGNPMDPRLPVIDFAA